MISPSQESQFKHISKIPFTIHRWPSQVLEISIWASLGVSIQPPTSAALSSCCVTDHSPSQASSTLMRQGYSLSIPNPCISLHCTSSEMPSLPRPKAIDMLSRLSTTPLSHLEIFFSLPLLPTSCNFVFLLFLVSVQLPNFWEDFPLSVGP